MSRQRPAIQPTAKVDWHKANIKAALEIAGWSFRSLAKHHELTHGALTQALRSRYPASEKRIADAIGVHPMVLWPSRYNADGTSNGQRGNPNWIAGRSMHGKRSTAAGAVNVKSARAR